MQKSNFKFINLIFLGPQIKKPNWSIIDYNNTTIVKLKQIKKEKKKLKFVKDKPKEILALTNEWSYEEINK